MRFWSPLPFDHRQPPAVGVLLTNLGTPQAPTQAALRKYLKEFLSDPRVVEPPPPRWVWWCILNGIILNVRPARSARLYAKIWTPQGSPLLATGLEQARALETRLRERIGTPLHVALGMRYGQPSLEQALRGLLEKGCTRVLVFPLYPQYSGATTGSTFDALGSALQRIRWTPAMRTISSYHDAPAYIQALTASVREHWQRHGQGDRLMISFHGLPRRYLLAGDPYYCHCHKTARLLAQELGLEENQWAMAFQSRFGREPWLEPYADATLQSWGREGLARVDVICPGFSADCLETLEEMALTNRRLFQAAGGGEYHYILALNQRPDHIEALAGLAKENLQGWSAPAGQYDAQAARSAADQTQQFYQQIKDRFPGC